ncbi:MAG: SGNH/GDSL hydrolase family protein [Pseudomonadota bacterium]
MIVNSRTVPAASAAGDPWRRMIRIDTVSGEIDAIADGISAYAPAKVVFAEGDSWLDKFTPVPQVGTNLLDAIRTPFHAAVVDVAHIGDTSVDVVTGWQAKRTRALFRFFDFNAIVLSVGANDLKNLYADRVEQMIAGGLSPQEIQSLLEPATYAADFERVVANIRAFVALRDGSPRGITRQAPIILNGYDYFQPRPARAAAFAGSAFGAGPWVYPVLQGAGLNAAQMKQAADAVIDRLNQSLADAFRASASVVVIDSRGVLTPARPGTTAEDGDWLDEIHPSAAGFDKLAGQRWSATLAGLLR